MGNHPTIMMLKTDQFIKGSIVLVQGASSGIGKEMAKIYAARGCPLVITGRNEKELQEIVKFCESKYQNKNVHYITGEATNESDC